MTGEKSQFRKLTYLCLLLNIIGIPLILFFAFAAGAGAGSYQFLLLIAATSLFPIFGTILGFLYLKKATNLRLAVTIFGALYSTVFVGVTLSLLGGLLFSFKGVLILSVIFLFMSLIILPLLNSKNRRYLLIIMGALILVGVWIAKTPRCKSYGGRPMPGKTVLSCECMGIELTIRDEAPSDGKTITKCLGFRKSSSCQKYIEDQKMILCSEEEKVGE